MLSIVGVCLWQGSSNPFSGCLVAPVPTALACFGGDATSWPTGIFPSDVERVKKAVVEAAQGRSDTPIEYRMLDENAEIVWVRHWFAPVPEGHDQIPSGALKGTIQVIDEQKRLEAECLRVGEHERRAIGLELHDDHCQLLAGLASMLRSVERGIDEKDVGAKESIEELLTLLNLGMSRARSLAHGLVRLRVTDDGAEPAFQELAKTCAARFRVDVTARFSRRLPRHDPAQVFQLYRIAQEAISNAVRHGHASRISLRCLARGGRVRLSIRDNGIGLPPEELRIQGVGLQIMTYRATSIGGRFRVSANNGGGTTVTVDYECEYKNSAKTT